MPKRRPSAGLSPLKQEQVVPWSVAIQFLAFHASNLKKRILFSNWVSNKCLSHLISN